MAYSGDRIPTMTGSTTPSGVASASSEYGTGYEAWRAFDDLNAAGAGWICGSASPNSGWLQYQFDSGKTITKYTVRAWAHVTPRCLRSWTFKGSNDGSSWTTLDTQTHGVWSNGQQESYEIANSTSYTYYRIDGNNSGVGEDYLLVGEIEMMETITEAPPQIIGDRIW